MCLQVEKLARSSNFEHGLTLKVLSMKPATILFRLCLLEVCFVAWPAPSVFGQKGKPDTAQTSGLTRAEDESALKTLVAEFTKAFNAGDARKLAGLFTSNARVVTLSGQASEGKEAIEGLFATSFRDNPGQTIVVKPDHVRFLGPDAAIEEGIATIDSPGSADESRPGPEPTRYLTTYVKQDGKWLQDSIRDYILPESADTASAHDHLKELEWLIGDWVDESDEATVRTTCRWSEHQSFLIRSFEVKVAGKEAMTGSQRIGWDPRSNQVRSWVFDSDGGFSEALWWRDRERWVIKSQGVLKDGRTASATHVLTRTGRDHIKWASIDRTAGTELLPDAEEIRLVRTPPRPRSARPATKAAQ
jgi:uncharacterized protein (TIGR02246 family)